MQDSYLHDFPLATKDENHTSCNNVLALSFSLFTLAQEEVVQEPNGYIIDELYILCTLVREAITELLVPLMLARH